MQPNETHDQNRTSWIEIANHPKHDFPIQNLPYCTFEAGQTGRCIGIGIGDQILNLRTVAAGLDVPAPVRGAAAGTLNDVMALPADDRSLLRKSISDLLEESNPKLRDDAALRSQALCPQASATFCVPANIRDYSDFYASVYHATNVGSMFRPTNPLLPNYKWIPIGYHGRASSIIVSGHPLHRPVGQTAPAEEGGPPVFKPCGLLDYEMEVAIWVAGGNELGQAIPIDQAESHLFGLSLCNDWSARDLQKWEYQPLGPFLAKSFATTVSPWIVTMEALAPFRCPAFDRPDGDPQPLPYLNSAFNREQGGVDLNLEVYLDSEKMRQGKQPAIRLSHGNFRDLYWTPAQMLTHHASNGCNLAPGDVMASGTVSGKDRGARGCLLELTWDGSVDNVVPGSERTPIELPDGTNRKFLADGDQVRMEGYCEREGYHRIGFGSCGGTILPAVQIA